ncbi:MAG: Rrf2 family transcriptional regulator [Nitrospirales bacterium]
MRLSKKSEYGLRAMIELRRSFGRGVVQRRFLSEQQGIPLGFLEIILLQLKNSGLVGSRRGKNGGVFLLKPPREVTLGKIIRTLDGPLAPIGCVSQTAYRKCEDCPYEATATCPIQKVMLDVRNAIASVLDHYSLEDFANSSGKEAQDGVSPTIQAVLRPSIAIDPS